MHRPAWCTVATPPWCMPTGIIGGYIADHVLGYQRSILLGAIIMAAGLFVLLIEDLNWFLIGLALIVAGNGLFKPNISVMVGNLYEPGDPKRDAGFNIFYMGINIGAFVASFLSSWVRNDYGWLWTFRAAAIGLLIGLGILFLNWKTLERADRERILEELLEELHISHIRNSTGLSLSGGERRRVEIARALAIEPKFILLDEPFAGVDPISILDIQKIIKHLSSRDIGVLITDHNVRETLGICGRAYILNQGEMIAEGDPDTVLANQQVREVYLGENFAL